MLNTAISYTRQRMVRKIINNNINKKKHTRIQRYVDFDTNEISFAYTRRRVTWYFDHDGAKPTMTTMYILYRALLFKYMLF